MHMTRTTEGWFRLGTGVVLNVVLLLCSGPAASWGGYDREAHYSLIMLAVAVPAFVMIVPLFWRGQPWQAAVAFPLLCLPVIVLWAVADTILNR
jgi:hypothetical protein